MNQNFVELGNDKPIRLQLKATKFLEIRPDGILNCLAFWL